MGRTAQRDVARNARAHGLRWRRYETAHPEIFNSIEQTRLRAALERALAEVRADGSPVRALDYGCGSGNLTRHLLELGCEVVAADVTPQFLRQVNRSYGVETFRLNGHDLRGLEDERFDFVAAYSVLHHIPDYLAAVADMPRVLRRGGVLFLDHEHVIEFFRPSPALAELREAAPPPATFQPGEGLKRYLEPWRYAHRLRWWYTRYRLSRDPKWQPEGDIHIFEDQHIEWDRIRSVLEGRDMEVVDFEEYLVYRPHYPPDLWESYRDRCADLGLMIARRCGTPA